MFMKVYQYPPRRGNGSYWTLLSDGEEELKKAVPLFATLQPPVIDTNCAYHREPSTHTVKSKGRYVPVLPRSDMAANLPYFSLSGNIPPGLQICSGISNLAPELEVEEFPEAVHQYDDQPGEKVDDDEKDDESSDLEQPIKKPKHLHDHSYAKELFQDVEEYMDGSVDAEVVELATGIREELVARNEDRFFTPSGTNKKRKIVDDEPCYPQELEEEQPPGHGDPTPLQSSPPFVTPTKGHNNSLHLLDSSLLTPLKSLVPDAELGPITFSPLYTSLATPKHKRSSHEVGQFNIDCQSHPYLPSPFTPLKGSFDSGIFSPLRGDSLGGLKFSTPTNISPLGDLNSFSSFQPELCPIKILDNSAGSTPVRPGSLRALGLPGLTPPTAR